MSIMYAQMGMSIVGGLAQMNADSTEFKLKKLTQKYQNTMSQISKAQQENTMTDNEISFRDSAVLAKKATELQSLRDTADAEVSAATAGTAGGSVNAVLLGLRRSRLSALSAMDKNILGQRRAFAAERRNVAFSAIYNKDITVLSRPSTASALLGMAAGLIDIYDESQPAGQKTSDSLARLFGS